MECLGRVPLYHPHHHLDKRTCSDTVGRVGRLVDDGGSAFPPLWRESVVHELVLPTEVDGKSQHHENADVDQVSLEDATFPGETLFVEGKATLQNFQNPPTQMNQTNRQNRSFLVTNVGHLVSMNALAYLLSEELDGHCEKIEKSDFL